MKSTIIRIFLLAAIVTVSSLLQAQSLSLDSCIALARRNNIDIRTSQLEIERAQAVKAQIFTKYFPQLHLGALGYYAVNPLISFSVEDIPTEDLRDFLVRLRDELSGETDMLDDMTFMQKGASVSAVVAQPIFAGGRIVNGNRLARLGVEAAGLQADVKIRDVIENIESSYYLVVGLQQKVSTVAAALDLIDSLDHTVQLALASGLVTRADALQVQLKRNEMLANRQQLASGIRLAKRMLCRQIGIDYSDALVFDDSIAVYMPPLAYTYSDCADSLRPEMRLLQLNVEAERLQRKLTLGETLPQLTLAGSAYYGNLIKTDANANAIGLLSLSVPLTGWIETSRKLRQHDIKIQEAELMQDPYSRMMSLEEEKAYSDMVDAYVLMQSDSSALDVAIENYRLANLNYTAGAATLSDVLQAHALLLQAQNAITDRRTTYAVARRRLMDLRSLDK